MPTTKIDLASPDCIRTRNPAYKIDRVVIHTMEGSFQGTIAWFKTPNRSVPTAAHYLIGKDGSICQMVPDDKKALHAGSSTSPGWNDRSIGLEHEGWADRGAEQWTEELLRASAKVTAAMCKKFNIPCDRTHVLGHSEVPGVSHHDPGPTWPWEMYMTYVKEALV